MDKRVTTILARIIATGAGSGYSPLAPGTAGSLLGAVLWWVWADRVSRSGWDPLPGTALSIGWILLAIAAGVWASGRVVPDWGKDPSRVVVDEIAGTWIALLLLPHQLAAYALGLVLFRLFDIWKPLGIRRLERYPGGWGIMLDDVAAGLYAAVVGVALSNLFG